MPASQSHRPDLVNSDRPRSPTSATSKKTTARSQSHRPDLVNSDSSWISTDGVRLIAVAIPPS